jgi:threonine/homoserine efflux transporter RhtA
MSSNTHAEASRGRFAYLAGFVLAAVFMVALAAVQVATNGGRGIRDARFLGLELGVGLLSFRAGYVLARAYARLSHVSRARRTEPK